MSLVRISDSSYNAAGRTIQAADTARESGFEDVRTHYEPETRTHVATTSV